MSTTTDYLRYIEHHLPKKLKSLKSILDDKKVTPENKVNKFLEYEYVKGMWEIYKRLKNNNCLIGEEKWQTYKKLTKFWRIMGLK